MLSEPTTSGGCENESPLVFTSNNQTEITSPNWPDMYPPLCNVTWILIASPEEQIKLSVKGYHLQKE